ncbi:glycerol-3-phosphate ABC transporter ATP-binding protein [Sporosarcina sp. NCCP-2716]|uniref:ABC transporter ATP-binding protein n=1 Tax=Sporosarcina sp. NCCP-2716 TaxID=2943679 RepID=UPI00207E7431|nr:sn-glycerol-3-phosphate ABC transporter ATP-binding protein UgpC [Sporosarcina sp. NCCP-2716]GKV70570.1 glycerol-3-phosphate ABC transporter ATP-binding protein [Sporosarcina sp. NCCP-2716]
MKAIDVSNLNKAYRGEDMVLEDVSFDVQQGEFFVIVGPSGCGKSTLLRIIAGLEEISAGTLYMNGEEAGSKRPNERQISMVFQNYALFPHLSVRENILFGLHVKKIAKQQQQERCLEAAHLLGLDELLDRKPRELSGGQRQRVALGRAIASEAPICLMDEPLSNLDAKLRTKMRAEVRQLQRRLGMTMVYVTHDQVEAMTMADRIMVLNEGSIQQIGRPLDVYNYPQNLFVATFIGSPPMNITKTTRKGRRLQLTDGWTAAAPDLTEDVYAGVRPEHLTYAADAPPSFFATVEHLEILGTETLLMFRMNGELWIAKWPGQWDFREGQNIPLKVADDHIHFFNAATGERIGSRPLPAGLTMEAAL